MSRVKQGVEARRRVSIPHTRTLPQYVTVCCNEGRCKYSDVESNKLLMLTWNIVEIERSAETQQQKHAFIPAITTGICPSYECHYYTVLYSEAELLCSPRSWAA